MYHIQSMDDTASSFKRTHAGLQTMPQDVILMIARYLNRLELLALSQSCGVALHTSQQFSAYWRHDLVPALLPENGISSGISAQDFRLAALRSSRLKARLQLLDNKPTKLVEFRVPDDALFHVPLRTRILFIFPQYGYTAGCYDTWTGKLVGQWISPDLNKWGPPMYLHQVDSLCVSANEIVLAVAYEPKFVVYRLRVLITQQKNAFHAEFHPEAPKTLGSVTGSVQRIMFGEGLMVLVLSNYTTTTRIYLWKMNGEGDIPLLLNLTEEYNERVILESGKLLMYRTHYNHENLPIFITLHVFSLHKISNLFSHQNGNAINGVELPVRGTYLCAASELGYNHGHRSNAASSMVHKSSNHESWIELIAPEVPDKMSYLTCTIEEDEEDSLAYKLTVKRETATQEIPINPFLSIRGTPPVYWGTMNAQYRHWSDENRDYEYKSLSNGYTDPSESVVFDSESGCVLHPAHLRNHHVTAEKEQ